MTAERKPGDDVAAKLVAGVVSNYPTQTVDAADAAGPWTDKETGSRWSMVAGPSRVPGRARRFVGCPRSW